ncbi:MAG TPA: DUF2752 domain-containing protein [Chthoniobacterales bacterium]|nr:DUF2752 domain-containing protein [Chthoniobacterales bacterium]
MRVYWRRLRPGELDHELLWLAVSVTSAALGSAWFAMGLPWPRCNFRALFGIPCFTCGATRAAVALLGGDLVHAWTWNPLATVTMLAIVLFDIYAFAVLLLRAPRLRFALSGAKWLLVALVVTAAGLNWAYLLTTHE